MGSHFRDIAHHDREDMAEGVARSFSSESLLLPRQIRKQKNAQLAFPVPLLPMAGPNQPRDVILMLRVTLPSSVKLCKCPVGHTTPRSACPQ